MFLRNYLFRKSLVLKGFDVNDRNRQDPNQNGTQVNIIIDTEV